MAFGAAVSFLVLSLCTAATSDWFVDPNHGMDSNDGTRSAPFKSLERAQKVRHRFCANARNIVCHKTTATNARLSKVLHG